MKKRYNEIDLQDRQKRRRILKKQWKKLEKIFRPNDNLDSKRIKVGNCVNELNKKIEKKKKKYFENDKKRQETKMKLEKELKQRQNWGNNYGVLRESVPIITEKKISNIQKFNL
jgi:hypothetical protein